MPIPGLTVKNKSAQSWRHNSSYRRQPRRPLLRRPNFAGRFRAPSLPVAKLGRGALTLIVVGIGLLGIASLVVLGSVARDLPNPNRIIDRSVAQSTKIYDRTGETLLYDVHGAEQRTVVKLEDIPDYIKQATITAEDRKFYEHKGISLTGIIRSIFKNITTGSRVGGSTLTQQLVKNAILSPEKKYSRKLKEVILSYQIEKKFTKDEILQLYFNEIPYGSVAYGVEAASQTYFSKKVQEVTLAEAAILAALPQAPTYYSPYGSHTDALFNRQHYILDSMVEEGYITEAKAEAAKLQKIEFKKRAENLTAPHFVLYVKEYLTQKYGELAVEQGGLKVITTLDLYKQKIAEEVITERAGDNAERYNAHNAALVAIDPKTGQVLALVGSKDYFADPYPENCAPGKDCLFDPQVNIPLRPRQPGSSFKPIVYAAAFRKGYTPETVLYDVNTSFINYDGRNYEPKNYDLGEHGPVTMTAALAGSLNIPAVKTIYITGVDQVIDLAEQLGYTTLKERSRFGLSLVLGGAEVGLLEHTNAYAVFAREGEWHPPVIVLEVRDKDNNLLEEQKKTEKKVVETEVARQINSILTNNAARAYIFGADNYLTLGGRPVAAKTGTTNDYRDAWTVGYTPSLATGVWVGNSSNAEMKRGADGSVVAAPIWNAFMSRVLGDTPAEGFNAPRPTESDKPVLNGSIAEGGKVKIDRASGKLATSLTPENMVEEKTYRQAHSILYWINKDNPQGDTPPDRSGAQYERWETAVAAWAQKNNFTNEEPPTEFDDVHTLANLPSITILSPKRNQTITSRSLGASVAASAPRGSVSRIEYYLNDKLIATVTSAPFDLRVSLQDPSLSTGSAALRAVAYDDVDNSQSDEVRIGLDLPPITTQIDWTTKTSIKSNAFPFAITANVTNAGGVDKIDLYFQKPGGGVGYINTSRQFPNGLLSSQWQESPGPGSYQIYAEVTDTDGFKFTDEALAITVE